jgi:hypothetical protein
MRNETAVEFLKDQLEELFITTPYLDWEKIFSQAKAKEKQQIIEAFDSARIPCKTNDYGISGFYSAKDYFNKKYNK